MNDRAEFALWCEALTLLIQDAVKFHRHGEPELMSCFEQAYDDMMQCGPMLRHLCDFTGNDPEWISWKFRERMEREVVPRAGLEPARSQ